MEKSIMKYLSEAFFFIVRVKQVFTLMKQCLSILFPSLLLYIVPAISYSADDVIVIATSMQESETAFILSEMFVDEVGKKMGKTISLVHYPGIRSARMLEKGTLHAEFSRVAEFQKKVPSAIRVTETVGENYFYAFTPRNDITVNGWDSLKPYRIVIVRGYVIVDVYLKDHRVHATGSMLSALEFLRAGRADLLVADPMTPMALLNLPLFVDSNIKRLEPPVDHLLFYTFFSYKYPHYAKQYNDALIALKKEGLYQRLKEKIP